MVIKGGSHLCGRDFCVRYRPSAREAHEANLPISHIGFRTVDKGYVNEPFTGCCSMVDTNIGIDTVSFHCRACGKCCNSAPLMSVGELFHHERLFVGCLALRKVKRHGAGDTLLAGGSHYRLSAEDARLLDDLNDAQLFKIGSSDRYYLSIMTQAMDYEALNRCPALNENQGCSIHGDRKPAVCSMAPFDSLYPDSLQNIVLLSRRFDENCIVTGQPDGYQRVVANRQEADQSFRVALQNRRDDLMREKQLWGNTVFQTLCTELLCHPDQAAKIPADDSAAKIPADDSAVLLSIIPVFIAGVGEPVGITPCALFALCG